MAITQTVLCRYSHYHYIFSILFLEYEPCEQDTLQFQLKIKCTKSASFSHSSHADDMYEKHKGKKIVLSY